MLTRDNTYSMFPSQVAPMVTSTAQAAHPHLRKLTIIFGARFNT